MSGVVHKSVGRSRSLSSSERKSHFYVIKQTQMGLWKDNPRPPTCVLSKTPECVLGCLDDMDGANPAPLCTLADVPPEVAFTPSNDNAAAQRISRMRQQGLLRQLYRGVYTSTQLDDSTLKTRRDTSRRAADTGHDDRRNLAVEAEDRERRLKLSGVWSHQLFRAEHSASSSWRTPGHSPHGEDVCGVGRLHALLLERDKRLEESDVAPQLHLKHGS